MDDKDRHEQLPKKPARLSRVAASAALNGGGWKKRATETLTCPSGQAVQVRRPGPEFILRAGKVARTFSKYANDNKSDSDNEIADGLTTLENMSDDELAAVLVFARELVCAMLVSPKLVREPRANSDEIGPDDIGDDFWFLFNYAMSGYFNIKVPVGSEEVEISDLESFRSESGVSGDSVDGPEIRPNPEQFVGDSGLVGSA